MTLARLSMAPEMSCLERSACNLRSRAARIGVTNLRTGPSAVGVACSLHCGIKISNHRRTRNAASPAHSPLMTSSNPRCRVRLCRKHPHPVRASGVNNGNSISEGAGALVDLVEDSDDEPPSSRIRFSQQQVRALVGAVMLNAMLGSFYCWSCYLAPLQLLLGADRSLLSGVFSAATAAFTLSTTFAGPPLYRALPPSGVLALAVGVGAAGLGACALCGVMQNVLPLYLGFALMFGACSGVGYGLTVKIGNTFFADSKGLATGCIVSSRAVGAALFAPLLRSAIDNYGVSRSFVVQAAGLVACAVPVWLLFRGMGAQASQDLVDESASSLARAEQRAHLPLVRWMWAVMGLGSFSGLMTTAHAAAVASSAGASPEAAAAGVSVVAVFSALGRVGGGWMCDAFPPARVMAAGLLLATAPMLWAASVNSQLSCLVALAGSGLAYGSIAIGGPVLVGRVVGANDFSQVYGKVFISWGVAGLSAPWLAGYLFDKHGNYQIALLVAAFSAVFAGLVATVMPSDVELSRLY